MYGNLVQYMETKLAGNEQILLEFSKLEDYTNVHNLVFFLLDHFAKISIGKMQHAPTYSAMNSQIVQWNILE